VKNRNWKLLNANHVNVSYLCPKNSYAQYKGKHKFILCKKRSAHISVNAISEVVVDILQPFTQHRRLCTATD